MKSIVEQYNAYRLAGATESEAPPIPVLSRLCRSPLKRLARAYRDEVPLAMLVSHSRFAPGYVLDRFLATIDAETTVIRVEQSFDDPVAFMGEVLSAIGFESGATSLAHLEQAFRLFLRYQKTHRRRTVMVVRDVDAQGKRVLAKIRDLVEIEHARACGLMIVATGPANDSLEPSEAALETMPPGVSERIVLTPFVLSETREFISDRFERRARNGNGADSATPRFEVYASQLIHELSRGVPETVDLLCRKSVQIATSARKTAISIEEVKAAAQVVGLMAPATVEEPEAPQPAGAVPGKSSPQLIVKVQGEPERTVQLNGSNLLIGRDRLCDICIEDVQVSRLHGLIARAADGVYYLDLGSTNGSAVNGETAKRLPLGNNDVIAVGDARIIFALKDGADSGAADLDATDTFRIPVREEHPPINFVGEAIRRHRET